MNPSLYSISSPSPHSTHLLHIFLFVTAILQLHIFVLFTSSFSPHVTHLHIFLLSTSSSSPHVILLLYIFLFFTINKSLHIVLLSTALSLCIHIFHNFIHLFLYSASSSPHLLLPPVHTLLLYIHIFHLFIHPSLYSTSPFSPQ